MVAILSQPQYINTLRSSMMPHSVPKLVQVPGPQININMISYQYRKSHCGDKTILRPSYLHNGISYTGKTTDLYWIRALVLSAKLLPKCPAINYPMLTDCPWHHYEENLKHPVQTFPIPKIILGKTSAKLLEIHQSTNNYQKYSYQLTSILKTTTTHMLNCFKEIDGILPKGPYPPCLRMADRALLSGYPRNENVPLYLLAFLLTARP